MEGFGDGPKPNFLDPRLYNVTNVPTTSKIDEDKDRQIIDKWLMEKGKYQLAFLPFRKNRSEISINAAKNALKSCLTIVDKLNKTQEELRKNVEVMSSNEWKQKTLDIGNLKDEFDKLMVVFEDNTILKSLKGAIVKRNKKRKNTRKRKLLQRDERLKQKDQLGEIHKNIDRWLESKKEEAERVKMEEKMKKDADCVLYEVTKKKSEARKEISLISALVKLRNVRDSMATQRGEKLSLEDRKAFGLVTEKLIRMWENSYQNYCKEEQCLKVMLEHNATNDTKALIFAKQTKVTENWENLIFGEKEISNNPTFYALTAANRDLETFIAIRKSWDTFLTNQDNTLGSAIPIGWVTPPENPNEAWANFLT